MQINSSINKITLALAISLGSTIFSNAVWAAEWTLTGNSGSESSSCNGTSCNNFKALLQKISDGDTINLTGNNTLLARDGSSIEDTLTIDKIVTINGQGHTLRLGGFNNLSLEKDVNFDNITLLTSRSDNNPQHFPTSAHASSANIFLNGNKLSLNNTGTKDSTRNDLNPNIIIGSMNGKQDAGHGELTVTNSREDIRYRTSLWALICGLS